MSQVVDRLRAARDASERRDWKAVHELLSTADAESPLGADDLERLAEATQWAVAPEQAVPFLERAYALHVAAGDRRRAASVATELAHEYGNVRAQRSIGNGWLARATRLLADEPEGPEHGYVALEQSLLALNRNRFDEALAFGRRAEELGKRHGDRALEVRGLQRQGMAQIGGGDVQEGKALLDEAAAAALGGELDAYSTVVVYCNTIGACRDVAAFDQAGEWTERASAFCESLASHAFPGMCRVNRAEVMRFEGKLAEAEETAELASQELRTWAPRIAAAALYEMGEVRLRLGDLRKAGEAFDQADELGRDPEPGRSLLLLARGKVDRALASIRRAVADEEVARPIRARLLPALVEIAIEAGELDDAGEACAELQEIADLYDTPALQAAAAQTQGELRLAKGNVAGAFASLRRALRLWQETNAAYDAARARVLLAAAYRADGDGHAAEAELARAGATFDRLGARIDAERVNELLGRDVGTRVTKTFVFTDIVDSTRTLEAVGDEKWTRALRWHDQTLSSIFTANEAEAVHETGDGFFVAFADAEHALDAAAAVQRALASAGAIVPDVRIGVHTAEATQVAENYRGKGVHVAARVAALAGAGEIVASAATVAGLDGVRTSDPRVATVKGVSEPIEVVSIDWRA